MELSREQIIERVRTIIAQQLHIEAETIVPGATLVSLGADSLDVVELVMRIEDEFSIEISDDAAEKLHTFGDFIDYLVAQKAS